MSESWLTVIGVGDGGLATLTPEQSAALETAEIVFGGARHLAMLEGWSVATIPWRTPFLGSLADIEAHRGRRVAVLASGDPLWFGVGGTLSARIPTAEMHVLPGPSSFQLAAAHLGWPLETAETLTVHGRDIAGLHRFVLPGARLLVLSADGSSPAAIAALLAGRGYGDSRISVLEHLGGPRQRVRATSASGFALDEIAALNIVAVDCVASPEAALLPPVPGLPDGAFVHDGKMTKRLARAMAIAALAPFPGAVLWDVGAGCGSVSVEWMRAGPRMAAIAFEPLDTRRAMIAANAEALGTPGLAIVPGRAPEAFDTLTGSPDAIFLGGGLSEGVFAPAYDRLKPGGRMVAHAVTLESEAILIGLHARLGGELLRIEVQRAEAVGPFRGWRPAMPVTHWHLVKSFEVAA